MKRSILLSFLLLGCQAPGRVERELPLEFEVRGVQEFIDSFLGFPIFLEIGIAQLHIRDTVSLSRGWSDPSQVDRDGVIRLGPVTGRWDDERYLDGLEEGTISLGTMPVWSGEALAASHRGADEFAMRLTIEAPGAELESTALRVDSEIPAYPVSFQIPLEGPPGRLIWGVDLAVMAEQMDWAGENAVDQAAFVYASGEMWSVEWRAE